MKLNFNYDGNIACRAILQDQLENLDIKYQLLDLGQIEISDDVSEDCFTALQDSLKKYGINIPPIELWDGKDGEGDYVLDGQYSYYVEVWDNYNKKVELCYCRSIKKHKET